MLKKIEVYHVELILNDGSKSRCMLLSKPDASILSEIAAAQNDPDFGRVLALAGEINVPAFDEGGVETLISIGGVIIGTITVKVSTAYAVAVKRGRKPKSVDDPVCCATACVDCTKCNDNCNDT